jgi:hypothetical protein
MADFLFRSRRANVGHGAEGPRQHPSSPRPRSRPPTEPPAPLRFLLSANCYLFAPFLPFTGYSLSRASTPSTPSCLLRHPPCRCDWGQGKVCSFEHSSLCKKEEADIRATRPVSSAAVLSVRCQRNQAQDSFAESPVGGLRVQ